MNYRILGKSGLKVSEISLGCWAIGGPKWTNGRADGWSGNNDEQSLLGLRKGYELGINHLDTADSYGDGHSERLIGQFLKEIPRDRVIVASKVGGFRGTAPHPMHPVHIKHQLEQTLSNLGTDYVDIYYFHTPYFGENNCYIEEASETMRKLQKEGKVRSIGQSAYSYEEFNSVCDMTRPDILQLPFAAIRSPFDHPDMNIFAWAEERNLGMVIFGAMMQGLLLDKFDPENPPTFGEGDMRAGWDAFTREGLLTLREQLRPIKQRFGSSIEDMTRVALQYALAQSNHACVIAGFKNPQQVEINAKASSKPLTRDEVDFIRKAFHPE